MTLTLKKQLIFLCGAVTISAGLLWNVGPSRAQNSDDAVRIMLGVKTPRVKLTRDEAAKNFVALLQYLSAVTSLRGVNYGALEPDAAMMSSFSRKSETEYLDAFLIEMAKQWNLPQQTVKVQSEESGTATVTVETNSAPTPRPLVLIQEGDSWGVDIEETYAKWNNLEGEAKTQAIERISSEFARMRENARRSSCQSNLKQIGLGIAQYCQDYDEKFPLAKPWVDVLQPYLKSNQIFNCPSVTDTRGYGYAYNSKLSAKNLMTVVSPAETVSVYETTVLKRNAYGMGENPAFRHAGGANYTFTDGHVKWFDKSKKPSFNLKP